MKFFRFLFALIFFQQGIVMAAKIDTIPIAFSLPIKERMKLFSNAMSTGGRLDRLVDSDGTVYVRVTIPATKQIMKDSTRLNNMMNGWALMLFDFLLCDSLKIYRGASFNIFIPNSRDTFQMDVLNNNDVDKFIFGYKYNVEQYSVEDKALVFTDASLFDWHCSIDRKTKLVRFERTAPSDWFKHRDWLEQQMSDCAKFVYAYILRNGLYAFKWINLVVNSEKGGAKLDKYYKTTDAIFSGIYSY
jgi:hypothetical protein